ncbi:MAG: phage tail sheath subtilisin-like domain-containing protein [Bacteroidales bacterium]|nr:phage tail sheath subtilisin-like domain-containing protein [Bacteroidales bacterium]
MANYKTPGVYIEEISTLPASIAPVATAIPAFIGYTEDHTRNKESVLNKPVRILSMLEYTEIFGGPFTEEFSAKLTGSSTKLEDTSIEISQKTAPYSLYYHLRMYFENGGGPCYIVSIGTYASKASDASIDKALLIGGLDAVSKEDEVTLLAIPEAIKLEEADRKDVYDAMLTQCYLLQDRFSIFDVITDSKKTVKENGDHFRDSNIGTDYLKYGAAYYPPLKTTINYYYKDDEVEIKDIRTGGVFTGDSKLSNILNGSMASATITIIDNDTIGGDVFKINGKTITEGVDFHKDATDKNITAANLLTAIVNLKDTSYLATIADNEITLTAVLSGEASNLIKIECSRGGGGGGTSLSGATLKGGVDGVPGIAATGTITINDYTLINTDSFEVNGQTVTIDTGITPVTDNNNAAEVVLIAIQTLGDGDYVATRAANVITITAASVGVAGNAITLSYTDGGTGVSSTVSGATLSDGKDAIVGVTATGTITITDYLKFSEATFNINDKLITIGDDFTDTTNTKAATYLLSKIEALSDPKYTATRSGAVITITAATEGTIGNSIALAYNEGGATISGTSFKGGVNADKSLYNLITKEIKKNYVELYPCAAIAGIYARVDKDRGVWKAPANVSVNMVKDPSIAITKEEQENLNVDSTSGKSINAIRKFAGKGVIVWGARTLAGNDNEWRYIPVRRLFIFIEESVKKATEFVVFEPNDAKTWLRTKAMIENFLITLWKDGALTGAKPEHAFYVKIGLGQTMTSLDILEGRMNIEIGLAAVRPAEFIVLKFSHKLQVS